jgi:hypothetical protein
MSVRMEPREVGQAETRESSDEPILRSTKLASLQLRSGDLNFRRNRIKTNKRVWRSVITLLLEGCHSLDLAMNVCRLGTLRDDVVANLGCGVEAGWFAFAGDELFGECCGELLGNVGLRRRRLFLGGSCHGSASIAAANHTIRHNVSESRRICRSCSARKRTASSGLFRFSTIRTLSPKMAR